MAYQMPYGAYQPPRKERGMKRIVFGALGIIANGIGLLVMPFVAGIAVATVALLSASPASLGGEAVTYDASGASLHYVYVPADEAAATTCSVEGGSGVQWDPENTSVPASVGGTDYAPVGSFQVTGDQQVTITCEGASDVAVADIGVMGTIVGFGVGIAVPVLLGLAAIILLIWGIIARVRS